MNRLPDEPPSGGSRRIDLPRSERWEPGRLRMTRAASSWAQVADTGAPAVPVGEHVPRPGANRSNSADFRTGNVRLVEFDNHLPPAAEE